MARDAATKGGASSVNVGGSVAPGGSPKSISKAYYNIREVEATHTDKAIVQLMKEHNKLKKRLDIVS